MEQFFASLSKRQTMLLLTAVTFGGNDCLAALDHLPPQEGDLLKHRAQEMLAIPREKRIPLLVQEIKRLVTGRRRILAGADPERLSAMLKNERTALVQVVLKALPESLAQSVRHRLARAEVPPKHEVRADVLSIVRWKLDDSLTRQAQRAGQFQFTDVLTMQSRELFAVCDRMGARALALAIAGLADKDREALLAQLPPDQRDLAQRAAAAGTERKLNEPDARTMLEAYGALQTPSAALRSAGAQRLARACLAQSPEFAERVVERHAGELGKLLSRWIKEEQRRPVPKGDGGRADIVEQIERLAQKGVVDRPLRLPPPPVRTARPKEPLPAQVPSERLRPPPIRGGEPPPREERRGEPVRRAPIGGAVLAPIPPRRDPVARRQAHLAGAGASAEVSTPRAEPDVRRRDPIAEREARRAGAVAARGSVPSQSGSQRASRPDTSVSRVLRQGPDGKWQDVTGRGQAVDRPAVRSGSQRAVTSPALQDIPRRRKPPTGGSGGSRDR